MGVGQVRPPEVVDLISNRPNTLLNRLFEFDEAGLAALSVDPEVVVKTTKARVRVKRAQKVTANVGIVANGAIHVANAHTSTIFQKGKDPWMHRRV